MKTFFVFALLSGVAVAQTLGTCPAFPLPNVWNARVDGLPVHPESAAWLASVGPTAPLRLDDTMPINLVSGGAPVMVAANSGNDDFGLAPVPAAPVVESGSDVHLILVDQATCVLYEMFAFAGGPGHYTADSTAKWDLRSNALRTDGWTSADAAGLPIAAGILRYDEVATGIKHALRMTAPHTDRSYLWPARHFASSTSSSSLPPMGTRFRLKASTDISAFSPRLQNILQALKIFGAIVSDNGMPWGMQHDGDSRWDAVEMATLHAMLGSSMEAVDESSLMSDCNSGQAGAAGNQVVMTDALGRPNAIPLATFAAMLPSSTAPPINLALNKPATQSSLFSIPVAGVPAPIAARANDGNRDGNFYNGSVSHTDSNPSAWWQVDLTAARPLSSIVVWPRTDCCSDRLSDWWVFASDTPFLDTDTPQTLSRRPSTWASHQTTPPNPSTTIPLSVSARYVRVQLSAAGYLHLAEVEVMGQ